MTKKILITDDVHPLVIETLTEHGFECDFEPKITDSEVRKKIDMYNGLIINSKINVDATMLDRAPLLEWVGRLGSGMEIVDLAHARRRGVAVLSAPEGNRNAVAEHALGMLLGLTNQLRRADADVRNFDWQREARRGEELAGKTLGIVGFGHTGSAFALRAASLDMKILAYDKYRTVESAAQLWQTEWTTEPQQFWHFDHLNFDFVAQVSLEILQKKADFISFHLPLNAETRYFCDKNFIDNCEKNIILLNTSRGNVVKTTDLLASLDSGKVRAAGLDVFENEKTANFSAEERAMYADLYARPQVLLSPHIAGWTVESKRRIGEVLVRKILAVLAEKNTKN